MSDSVERVAAIARFTAGAERRDSEFQGDRGSRFCHRPLPLHPSLRDANLPVTRE
jgi:hypothetical protein